MVSPLKMFWSQLKVLVLRSINSSYLTGELSITLRQGILTCLPKGDKPRQYLKNWRPLSMLSIVYKIVSAALANRIKPLLPSLIPPTQTGFVDGQFIGDSTRLIYDLINTVQEKKIVRLLMLIDFENSI